jgi:hypothetical protein
MTESDRAPYPPHLEVLIPSLVARAKIGQADAAAQLERLADDKDNRTREKVLELRLRSGHGDRVGLLEKALQDSTWLVRQTALKHITFQKIDGLQRLVPLVARALSDDSQPLHSLAGEALRFIATTDEQLLASIYPQLEYQRAPLPYPPNATPFQIDKIDRKNKERAQEDYGVRRSAIGALCYPHGSLQTQRALLDVFDRPELETKKDLTRAFTFCPDQDGLVQELEARLSGEDGLSALFSLGALKRAELRPLFLQHLASDQKNWAEAAAEALTHVARPEDGEALQRCSEKWQTGPTPVAAPRVPAVVKGVHTMAYTSDAPGLREFLQEMLFFAGRDVGDGWTIHPMPEADMGCHPTNGEPTSGTWDVSFYCEDIRYSVATLKERGVEFVSDVEDQGFGLVTRFHVPGGFTVQLYEPKY